MKRLILLLCLTLTFGTLFAENKIDAKESSAKAVVTVSINLNVDLLDQMDREYKIFCVNTKLRPLI